MAAPPREEAVDVSPIADGIIATILSEVPDGTRLRSRVGGGFEDILYAIICDVNDPLIARSIRMDHNNGYSPTLGAIRGQKVLTGTVVHHSDNSFEVRGREYHRSVSEKAGFDPSTLKFYRELGRQLVMNFGEKSSAPDRI